MFSPRLAQIKSVLIYCYLLSNLYIVNLHLLTGNQGLIPAYSATFV